MHITEDYSLVSSIQQNIVCHKVYIKTSQKKKKKKKKERKKSKSIEK